jgi:hypothetical protein
MESIRIPRQGAGRPGKRPTRALADKAHSSRANRRYLRRRGIKAVIQGTIDVASIRIWPRHPARDHGSCP